MAILEKMCQNLKEQGVNATTEAAKTSALETLNPFDRTRNLGKIILGESNIDSINLEGIYENATQSGSAGTRNVLRLAGVDLDYVLKGNFQGKKNLLNTRLNVKRKGLLHPKVVEIHWEGNALAQELNNDTDVNNLLWQSVGQLSTRDIEVKTDENAGEVKIHVRDDNQVFQGVLPPFRMYEKIAEHIYALAGISGAGRPSPPAQSAASQPVSQTAGVKYCFKCSSKMLQDVIFCPNCGTKQD